MDYPQPVRVTNWNDSTRGKDKFIVDAKGERLLTLYGSNEQRTKLAALMLKTLNTETREDVMPMSCVYSRGDGLIAHPINAPIFLTHQESDKCIITVRFNDEPDVVLTWENPDPKAPWDYRVVEVVALMELMCVRADLIWLGAQTDEKRIAKISAMLVQTGFKLWA